MVLKIINKSGKDICLPWGQWNYEIKNDGELINPPTVVINAMKERFQGIEVVPVEEVNPEVEAPIDEPIAEFEYKDPVEKPVKIEIEVEKPVKDIKAQRGRPRKYA